MKKHLKFLVKCIDIAQKDRVNSPDKEEMDLIRRIGKKADELMDKQYDEYSNMSSKKIVLTNSKVIGYQTRYQS